jgi:hypothetical protein
MEAQQNFRELGVSAPRQLSSNFPHKPTADVERDPDWFPLTSNLAARLPDPDTLKWRDY